MEWLDRMVEVLDMVSDASVDGLTLTQMQRQTGIAKSTLHRMLLDMKEQGLVSQSSESRKFRLGPRSLVWGSRYLEGQDPARLLAEVCNDLSARAGAYTFLSRLDRDAVYCIHTCRPEGKRVKYYVHIGQTMPLHASAAAKAILAFLPSEEIERLLPVSLEAITEYTTLHRQVYMEELACIRQEKLAFCRNEMEESVTALAVPLFPRDGQVLLSLTVLGDSADIAEREEQLIRLLRQSSDEAGKYLRIF